MGHIWRFLEMVQQLVKFLLLFIIGFWNTLRMLQYAEAKAHLKKWSKFCWFKLFQITVNFLNWTICYYQGYRVWTMDELSKENKNIKSTQTNYKKSRYSYFSLSLIEKKFYWKWWGKVNLSAIVFIHLSIGLNLIFSHFLN